MQKTIETWAEYHDTNPDDLMTAMERLGYVDNVDGRWLPTELSKNFCIPLESGKLTFVQIPQDAVVIAWGLRPEDEKLARVRERKTRIRAFVERLELRRYAIDEIKELAARELPDIKAWRFVTKELRLAGWDKMYVTASQLNRESGNGLDMWVPMRVRGYESGNHRWRVLADGKVAWSGDGLKTATMAFNYAMGNYITLQERDGNIWKTLNKRRGT